MGEGKAKLQGVRGWSLLFEELPLVMVDKLVVEFTKSEDHSVSSIVGKGSFGDRWFVGLMAGEKSVFLGGENFE